jgi:RNA polymerase sigma factor (TIGR02999 family)
MPREEIARLVAHTRLEDARTLDRMWAQVYEELRDVAHRQLRRQRADHTYSTTDLVHEAYLKMADQTSSTWSDRLHFMAVSALAMRHILIDYARSRSRQKRGGDWHRVSFDKALVVAAERANVFLLLDRAITELSRLNARLAQHVEFRFFGGMTETEIAEVQGLSARTVRRDWRKAKAWLADALREHPPTGQDAPPADEDAAPDAS